MRLFGNAHFKFIEVRKTAYIGSAFALLLAIFFWVFFHFDKGDWVNYGVDFLGGTIVQVHFTQPMTARQLRGVVETAVPGSEISEYGSTGDFVIRAPQFTAGGTEVATKIEAAITQKFGAGSFTRSRVEAVGPKVGGELQSKALLAILVSFAATLIYLAFRFEWRYGVAATLATFHDLIFTLGFIAAFRIDVSLTTVAAVLTIVGYSLNDTVIIFDRIRENVPLMRRSPFATIANVSLWETIRRSLATTFITLLPIICLEILGGATLKDFAFALIVGVTSGAYSSIFIAAPLLTIWKEREPEYVRRKAQAAAEVSSVDGDGRGELADPGAAALAASEEALASEPTPELVDAVSSTPSEPSAQARREKRRQRRRSRPHGRSR